MTLTPIWDQLDRACELLPGELLLWSRRYLKNISSATKVTWG